MDTNLVLRDGTAHLTADESLTAVVVGPMTRPMWLHVLCPSTGSNIGATHTLDVELEFNDDGSTQINNANMEQIIAAGLYSMPFYTACTYLLVKLNTTDGGGGDLDLAHVKVWLAPAHRYDQPHDS
jgi:hypothetical protein